MENQYIVNEFEIAFGLDVASARGIFTATVKQFKIIDEKTRYWVTLHDKLLIDRFALHLDFYYHEDPNGKEKNYADFNTNNDVEQRELCQAIMQQIEKYR